MRVMLPLLLLAAIVGVAGATGPPDGMEPGDMARVRWEAPVSVVSSPPVEPANCTRTGVERIAPLVPGDVETCMNQGRGLEWILTGTCEDPGRMRLQRDRVYCGVLEEGGPGGGRGPPPWAAAWDVVASPFAGFWKWVTGGR